MCPLTRNLDDVLNKIHVKFRHTHKSYQIETIYVNACFRVLEHTEYATATRGVLRHQDTPCNFFEAASIFCYRLSLFFRPCYLHNPSIYQNVKTKTKSSGLLTNIFPVKKNYMVPLAELITASLFACAELTVQI